MQVPGGEGRGGGGPAEVPALHVHAEPSQVSTVLLTTNLMLTVQGDGEHHEASDTETVVYKIKCNKYSFWVQTVYLLNCV